MTSKPEIVAYMRPAFGEVVSQQEHAGWEHDAFRNPGTKYGEYSKNKALEYSEPLICLKDYEVLKAECEKLRIDAEFGRSVLAKREPGKKYGCHCDPEEGFEPDECVIDLGERHNCFYADRITVKEQCVHWRVIATQKGED